MSHHTLLEVGDVTVHNGWTLHCADVVANSNAAEDDKEDRYAFSVAYVDARVELREDVLPSSKTNGNARHVAMKTGGSPSRGDNEGMWSFRSLVGEVEPRTRFRHPMVPTVWSPEQKDHTK